MRVFSPEETAAALPYPALIAGLRRMFQSNATAPLRHHHSMTRDGEPEATLLLMPAWGSAEGFGGVKIVTVTPGNAARALPAVAASYLLFEEETGAHLAIFDGATLTARRTAAASALAGGMLARPDSKTLLLVGAGRVAEELPAAYRAVLPIERVLVWNRGKARRDALVAQLQAEGWNAAAQPDLQAGVESADIISCATLSVEPIIQGAWLKPGQHLDLIGAFTPNMREADDAALQRSRMYIDTDAALIESGEMKTPLDAGIITKADIQGRLADIIAASPSRAPDDITLFKSVGHALEDLAAAIVAYGR